MADLQPIHRNRLPEVIEEVLNTTGATHVTITLTEVEARQMVKDLRWTCKTTINYYRVEKVVGEIRE